MRSWKPALLAMLVLLPGCASHEFRCASKLRPINTVLPTPTSAPATKAPTP